MVFIKKLTASASGTLDFVDGASDVVFDSTYKEYMFTFKDIHPETDIVSFQFQVDTGTNTSYNQAITSTFFRALHTEDDTTTASVDYQTAYDLAQGTGFQTLAASIGNANDEHIAGYLHIFNPSSSTFVKHFIARIVDSVYISGPAYIFSAGYVNTTTALTRVQFKMSSDAIDAGDICLYGIK